jgi:hypothetical protein
MVAGTQRCTTSWVGGQGGTDSHQCFATRRSAWLRSALPPVPTIPHGGAGALAAHRHQPSCRRHVGRVPEADEDAGRDASTVGVV